MEPNNILRVTDTTLRDGHQSLWATRMRTADILEIIDVIDNAGYYSLEVWGGATFDVCLRFLRENPWERLRLIRQKTRTPLQMLLRGQNVVGYKNYPDDILERFIETAVINGIDIFRIFDALNDTRNLEAAVRAVKKYGGHAQGTLSYTISPVHTVDKYLEYAGEQVQLGIDSLCIKDMAGLLSPARASELVKALRNRFNIPVQIHCHASSGMSETAYLEGVKAGAGAIDTAVASMSGFSSQPAVETIHAIFSELGYQTGLDIDAIRKANRYFEQLAPLRAKPRGYESPVDSEILIHQIPGGMISNFRSQLQQQDALDKLPEVLEEVTRVRADFGFPPLVTPTSQIVGTQAVMNVLAGERYKIVPQEVKSYIKGMYGKSPAPVDEELLKKILGDEKPVTHRPADDLPPMLPQATKSFSEPTLLRDEEDILSYCLFPEVAMEYFRWRAMPEGQRPMTPADSEIQPGASANLGTELEKILHPEDYAGINSILEKASHLQLNELIITKGNFNLSLSSAGSNGKAPARNSSAAAAHTDVALAPEPAAPQQQQPTGETINAVMAGTFYRSPGENASPFVNEGDIAEAGQKICILEAMKLFNEILSPYKCKIVKLLVRNGQKITKGQALMEVERI
jgi:oxaloacetate decarboxylase (Na+ extruding) subunit alpha